MIVSFVLPRDPRHGVTRYAQELAEALPGTGVEVRVVRVAREGVVAAFQAARRARPSDVVHLQLADGYWAPGRRQLLVALALRLALVGRPTVVTGHDFHLPHRPVPRRPRGLLRYLRGRKGSYDATVRLLVGGSALTLTCTDAEAEHVRWAKPRRQRIVPLHVAPLGGAAHEPAGNQDGDRLVVLGWIHRRKGQHRAVEALPHLPDRRLVLAGAAPARAADYLDEVERRAADLGVEDRLTVTGFLPDEELAALLTTCRLALAPYERVAASASLATLMSVGLPVVALENDYVRDMAQECPTALQVYSADDPASLAAAVERCTAAPRAVQVQEMRRWCESRSPHRMALVLRQHYEDVVGPSC